MKGIFPVKLKRIIMGPRMMAHNSRFQHWNTRTKCRWVARGVQWRWTNEWRDGGDGDG